MELVVDTNRIIAALVKKGTSREIISSTKHTLYAVDFGKKEVKKYKSLIKKKARISEAEFNFLMERLLSKIIVYSEKELSKESLEQAKMAMEKIDADDVPHIALAIELGNKAIWSDDKHFKKQNKVKVVTTKELAKKL